MDRQYAVFPYAILQDKRLSAADMRVYGILRAYSREGQAFCSPWTIAAQLGIDPANVKRQLRRLREFGWISCTGNTSYRGVNIYEFTAPTGVNSDPDTGVNTDPGVFFEGVNSDPEGGSMLTPDNQYINNNPPPIVPPQGDVCGVSPDGSTTGCLPQPAAANARGGADTANFAPVEKPTFTHRGLVETLIQRKFTRQEATLQVDRALAVMSEDDLGRIINHLVVNGARNRDIRREITREIDERPDRPAKMPEARSTIEPAHRTAWRRCIARMRGDFGSQQHGIIGSRLCLAEVNGVARVQVPDDAVRELAEGAYGDRLLSVMIGEGLKVSAVRFEVATYHGEQR